jgi:hypothetical protein
VESDSKTKYAHLFPKKATPADVAPAVGRLLECASHASASGAAALVVLRALFGREKTLPIPALFAFDAAHREAALALIRFVAENPPYDAARDPRWSETVRQGIARVVAGSTP